MPQHAINHGVRSRSDLSRLRLQLEQDSSVSPEEKVRILAEAQASLPQDVTPELEGLRGPTAPVFQPLPKGPPPQVPPLLRRPEPDTRPTAGPGSPGFSPGGPSVPTPALDAALAPKAAGRPTTPLPVPSAREFILKYADRILYGRDSAGNELQGSVIGVDRPNTILGLPKADPVNPEFLKFLDINPETLKVKPFSKTIAEDVGSVVGLVSPELGETVSRLGDIDVSSPPEGAGELEKFIHNQIQIKGNILRAVPNLLSSGVTSALRLASFANMTPDEVGGMVSVLVGGGFDAATGQETDEKAAFDLAKAALIDDYTNPVSLFEEPTNKILDALAVVGVAGKLVNVLSKARAAAKGGELGKALALTSEAMQKTPGPMQWIPAQEARIQELGVRTPPQRR